MNHYPFDFEAVKMKRAAYDRWLTSGVDFAEVMRGLHGTDVRAFPLDQAGLKALGGELPRDWLGSGAEAGVLYAGGYDEDRAIYDSPVFDGSGGERRSVHLGVDVFAPAGTRVYAPLEAVVHSFADNAGALDYGPTLMLEHRIDGAFSLITLYGHLTRESLMGLQVGQAIAAGKQIATLGAPEVNGGWATHLHFQIILDTGGLKGDYPGVCKASERAAWLMNCPDPRPLLGLAKPLA